VYTRRKDARLSADVLGQEGAWRAAGLGRPLGLSGFPYGGIAKDNGIIWNIENMWGFFMVIFSGDILWRFFMVMFYGDFLWRFLW
jgi:hypothetical protein